MHSVELLQLRQPIHVSHQKVAHLSWNALKVHFTVLHCMSQLMCALHVQLCNRCFIPVLILDLALIMPRMEQTLSKNSAVYICTAENENKSTNTCVPSMLVKCADE